MYRSTDGGGTWTNATYAAFDPPLGVIGAIGIGPAGRGAAGTTGVPPTYWYRTLNGGTSWLPDPGGPSIAFTHEIAYWDADHALAAGDYGEMWRTTDGGSAWTSVPLPSPPANLRAYHLSLAAPGIAFAACTAVSEAMVCRTTDYGASWQARSTGIPLAGGLFAISFLDAGRGFAAGYTSGGAPRLFQTTDGGGWSPIAFNGLPSYVRDMHWHDEQVGIATLSLNPGGIYRTTNGGLNWQVVWAEPADELSFADALHGGATPFAFNAPGEIFITEDGGASWDALLLPAQRSGKSITALAGGFLVGGASSVILRITRTGTVDVGEDPAPETGGLSLAAIPTVGSRLNVSFRLAEPGPAELAVYDPAGRRVATLAEGHFPAGVVVSRTWDGLTLRRRIASDGVYFVRLSTPHAARATKIVFRK